MGRAKKVLGKLEEKTRANGMHKLALAARKQSTGKAVDASMTPTTSVIDASSDLMSNVIIQPGTVIQGVGYVTDVEYRGDGQSIQARYTVSGDTRNLGSMQYASSGQVVSNGYMDSSASREEYMKLRIMGILQSDQYAQSMLIQQLAAYDTCDISTLVNALAQCESTLRTVYALTRIAGEVGDVDFHRLVQSLRTLIMDESGVELDADSQSTPLDNSDGTGTRVGDGLLKIYEKNGSIDHMDGVAKEKIRVTCTHCNAGQLFDNGVCKLCGQYLPYPDAVDMYGRLICGVCTAINMASNSKCGKCGNPLPRSPAQFVQEMYGTLSGPQQRCQSCGATIEDKAYTCRRCGVSVYSGPIVTTGTVPVGKQIHPVLCTGCNKYYMDDKDVCPGCHTPRRYYDRVVCGKCGNDQKLGYDACQRCGSAEDGFIKGVQVQKTGDDVLLQWDEVLDKAGVPKLGGNAASIDRPANVDRMIATKIGMPPMLRCAVCGHMQEQGQGPCTVCGRDGWLSDDVSGAIANRNVKP